MNLQSVNYSPLFGNLKYSPCPVQMNHKFFGHIDVGLGLAGSHYNGIVETEDKVN